MKTPFAFEFILRLFYDGEPSSRLHLHALASFDCLSERSSRYRMRSLSAIYDFHIEAQFLAYKTTTKTAFI